MYLQFVLEGRAVGLLREERRVRHLLRAARREGVLQPLDVRGFELDHHAHALHLPILRRCLPTRNTPLRRSQLTWVEQHTLSPYGTLVAVAAGNPQLHTHTQNSIPGFSFAGGCRMRLDERARQRRPPN